MVQGQKHNVDGAKLQSCMKAQKDDAVKASVKEGSTLGVEATPTLFVNGEKIDGAMPIGDIRAVLDRALQQAGVASPPHAAAAASSPPQPASK
jgi:protein-disulfide isomerase